MFSTDFWWLSNEDLRRYRYVALFHQAPYSDEPNTDKDPSSCPMSQSNKRRSLDSVGDWKARFRNVDVFRSYALFSSAINGEEMVGPLLLDIDRTIKKVGVTYQTLKGLSKTPACWSEDIVLNSKGRTIEYSLQGTKGSILRFTRKRS